jgi:hypothetical protein
MSVIPRKKLQVFVSSTYEDLKEERQAAVEAILSAGHIPAGMELFAAGDESQMEVIRRWIDQSDVFLLILGARYGSIEPSSGRSYVELEYQYARERGKEVFSVVITEKGIEEKLEKLKLKGIERQNQGKLDEFRNLVTGNIVRWWTEPKDITIAILQKLNELSLSDDLPGWIRADQAVTSTVVAEEIARLAKENASLHDRLSQAESSERFTGLTFDEMLTILRAKSVGPATDGNPGYTLLDVLWDQQGLLQGGAGHNSQHDDLFAQLAFFVLVTKHPTVGYALTDDGRRFLLRLRFTREHRYYPGQP